MPKPRLSSEICSRQTKTDTGPHLEDSFQKRFLSPSTTLLFSWSFAYLLTHGTRTPYRVSHGPLIPEQLQTQITREGSVRRVLGLGHIGVWNKTPRTLSPRVAFERTLSPREGAQTTARQSCGHWCTRKPNGCECSSADRKPSSFNATELYCLFHLCRWFGSGFSTKPVL
jgi:hypothetical protein